MKKIVSLFSGGLDSTVLLYHLQDAGLEVLPISFLYGQRHARELNFAKAVAQHLALWKHEVVNLKHLAPLLAGSVLTDASLPVPKGHYEDESMKATVVPNRNMIMMSLAAAYAISRGASSIALSNHAGDHAIYPDCRAAFMDMMREALRLCHYEPGIELAAPFTNWTKAQIVARGRTLGVPFGLTWSCYEGREFHCGECGTCVERREAFAVAGVEDPTEYRPVDSQPAWGSGGSLTIG